MAFECVKEARKTFVTGKVVLESSQKIQLSYAVSFYKMICYHLYLATVVRHYAVAVGVIILLSDCQHGYVLFYRTFDSMPYHFFAAAQIKRSNDKHINNIIVRQSEDVCLTYIMRRSIVEAGTAVEDMYIYMIIAEYFTKAL